MSRRNLLSADLPGPAAPTMRTTDGIVGGKVEGDEVKVWGGEVESAGFRRGVASTLPTNIYEGSPPSTHASRARFEEGGKW
jgi:hypothetical protein